MKYKKPQDWKEKILNSISSQKQGTSQEICTGTFDGSGNLTHYNWDPKKIHPYTVIWIGTIFLATCIMVFTEIGRHKAPKLRVNVPIGIGTKTPKSLESALLNFALTALILLNQTSYSFYFKKWEFQIFLVKNDPSRVY